MSSNKHYAAAHAGSRHVPQAGYAPQPVPPQSAIPAGTFSPGTKIQVGSHRVVIQKYLSEGGFAHVYLVKLAAPVDGTDLAVLKRVAVPDKDTLRGMRTEVETMKRLKGHRPIVTYIDSHASEMRGGGYEVFLLMEYCDGGGLIDFMNTRLQHRLTEPEILHIFADVAEGVACMHYLKPPLLHRDLKVENVLIVKRGSSKRFKVCDFGSAAPPRPAPTTIVECRAMDEDVQRHTTLQYRAPEMVDVYRKQPLNEKSDIWALGVFLYKLCYYTTPFEDQGQLAILNASYKYPAYPTFSDRLKKLIASMLRESMQSRPNIYQVLKEACTMQGRAVPIHDIYTGQKGDSSSAEKTSPRKRPQGDSKPVIGAVHVRPTEEKPSIPTIVPMRRGRPTASQGPPGQGDGAPKVTDGDPFAALDSKSSLAITEADEMASRFPTLDQFSLLHDQGANFDFDTSKTSPPPPIVPTDQSLAERLADETFASPQVSPEKPSPAPVVDRLPAKPQSAPAKAQQTQPSRASAIISNNPDLKAITSAPQSKYVSTGTMTLDLPPGSSVPQHDGRNGDPNPKRSASAAQSPDTLPIHSRPPHLRKPSLSSRPSLEDNRHQAQASSVIMSKATASLRPRPASTSFEPSTLDFLREKEITKSQRISTLPPSRIESSRLQIRSDTDNDRAKSSEDVSLDVADDVRATERGSTTSIHKRMTVSAASMPKKLANKLGDAFNRFEEATTSGVKSSDSTRQTAPPEKDALLERELTGQPSTNALMDMEEDDTTPEMRRELERQKLEEEERRVAAAQAEYRNRVTSSGKPVPGPKNVANTSRTTSTIQSRVQSLLNEDQKPVNVQRTAQGYGKYTDEASARASTTKSLPTIPRKLISTKQLPDKPPSKIGPASVGRSNTVASEPTPTAAPNVKPPAPKKKPTHLGSFPTGTQAPSQPSMAIRTQEAQPDGLIEVDLRSESVSQQEKEDYIKGLAKRFPSLSSIELDAQQRGAGGLR